MASSHKENLMDAGRRKNLSKLVFLLPLFALLFLFLPERFQYSSFLPFQQDAQQAPQETDSMEYVPMKGSTPMSLEEQFQSFPSPRFKPGHQLMRNMLWMDPIYFSGNGQSWSSYEESVQRSVWLQTELAKNWNYYLLVSSNTTQFNKYQKEGSFQQAWVKLANEHPEWPCAAISFWAQLRPEHLQDPSCNSKKPMVSRKDLHDSLYILEQGAKTIRRWNPANDASLASCDYRTQQFYITELLKSLKRPLNLINENAEVFHHFQGNNWLDNERVQRDMKKRNISDPEKYQAIKRLEYEQNYRDAFLKIPGNEKTLYSVYAIDGQNTYRHAYEIMREASTPMRGMHYACPDFYPRWPDNWKKWKGPWHGLNWIVQCRNREIACGDTLFSPFVAAGWDKDERLNIRPAQWLALMKVLGVMGAEFFYTGYFNLKAPFADPRQYAWQSVIPVYAQAALSHAEDILLQGHLLNAPEYLLETGDENIIAVARKKKGKDHYLLATAIMVNSNEKNDRAEERWINVKLPGMNLRLKARRQGSLYRIERSEEQIKVTELDAWHEDKHPARWTKNLNLNPAMMQGEASYRSGNEKEPGKRLLRKNESLEQNILLNSKQIYTILNIQTDQLRPFKFEITLNDEKYQVESTEGRIQLRKSMPMNAGINLFRIKCLSGEAGIYEIQFSNE